MNVIQKLKQLWVCSYSSEKPWSSLVGFNLYEKVIQYCEIRDCKIWSMLVCKCFLQIEITCTFLKVC
jgi:hypothetical protein